MKNEGHIEATDAGNKNLKNTFLKAALEVIHVSSWKL